MSNKVVVVIVLVLIAVLGAFLLYTGDSPSNMDNRTTLNVSSEGPLELPALVSEIRTHEYFSGYDNETVRWMESLGDKYVWSSADEYVIMDKWDSDKIPSAYVCDAYFNEIFSCNVLERHSLGQSDNLGDVVLVNDVEYIGEEIHYYDV
jgi:hypothetical protein